MPLVTLSSTGRPAARTSATRASSAVQARLWGQLRCSAVSSFAQHAEQPAHLGHRGAAGRGDLHHRLAWPVPDRLSLASTAASARVMMTDRLWAMTSCISRAIRVRSAVAAEAALLVAFTFEPRGAFGQRSQILPAGLQRDAAEQRRGDHPGQEDHRGEYPVTGRGEADRRQHDADLDDAGSGQGVGAAIDAPRLCRARPAGPRPRRSGPSSHWVAATTARTRTPARGNGAGGSAGAPAAG